MSLRRYLTVGFLTAVFGIAALTIYGGRQARLTAAEARLADYRSQYEEVLLQRDQYLNQISKLEQEEYVAMLARSKYFKSLPGELIFRFLDSIEGDEIPGYILDEMDHEIHEEVYE